MTMTRKSLSCDTNNSFLLVLILKFLISSLGLRSRVTFWAVPARFAMLCGGRGNGTMQSERGMWGSVRHLERPIPASIPSLSHLSNVFGNFFQNVRRAAQHGPVVVADDVAGRRATRSSINASRLTKRERQIPRCKIFSLTPRHRFVH